jgi:hypothetical protein
MACYGSCKGSGMLELSPETWDEIARRYADGVPVNTIVKSFNVSRARITRRANMLRWIRDGAEAGDAVASVQTQDAHPGSSQEARATSVGDVADHRTILIKRHLAAWDDVNALDREAMRILRGEEPQILKGLEINDAEERLRVVDRLLILFDKAARALMLAQEGERRGPMDWTTSSSSRRRRRMRPQPADAMN